jgi:hypothetical protein
MQDEIERLRAQFAAAEAKIEQMDEVSSQRFDHVKALQAERDRLRIETGQAGRARITIEELMGAYDPEKHRHDEVDWGEPVGIEVL